MSRHHKIRWTEQDTKELNRVVRNFNNKLKRLAKKNPSEANILPEVVSAKDLKELINTRQDLNRELNALKRFSKRGAEKIITVPNTDYNLRITKWQMAEINRRVGIINRRRKARLDEIKSLEVKSRGEGLGYTVEQLGMGKAMENALKPMQAFPKSIGNFRLKEKWKSILHQSQSDYFDKKDFEVRDNYIKGIMENYDYENVKDIIEHIRSMDIAEFLKNFQEHGSTFEIASPNGGLDLKFAEYQGYEEALRAEWLPNTGKNNSTKIITQNIMK